eukprot:TRINITY_DN8892_c0_g1_i1.p2 TRINITY_DN8892_c0_g1~~TRINITY_DN8892_c0_g1_i1.p2  ORF type:complete len:105 (-),score=11.66 TRINITY_DN8892_c0_g1_i1:607-921(-)
MCLIRDTKALAASGVEGATLQLLDIIISSQNEREYAVWNNLLSAMDDIVHIIDDDEEIMKNINAIMIKTLSTIYAELGFEEEEKRMKRKRTKRKMKHGLAYFDH